VPINKIIILIFVLISSFILTEVLCRYVVHYPDYGVEYFVYGISSSLKWQPVYRPYSRYFNNENSIYNVYERNNLGLPGINVDISKKKIFVLGSSFIEAAQLKPEEIATSIFQNLLAKSYSDYTVINLGRKSHDLYDSWFRYQYYCSLYSPDIVILVLDQRNSFNRHPHPLNFNLSQNFGGKDKRIKTKIGTAVLSNSSFFSLCYKGFRDKILADNNNDNIPITDLSPNKSQEPEYNDELQDLKTCITKFKENAKNRLIIISVFNSPLLNKGIKAYCDSLSIYCKISNEIQKTENQIKGYGHFNASGNKKLGYLMYDAFIDFIKNR